MKIKESYWLICPNFTEVRRFIKKHLSDDNFNKYMFVDTGIIVGIDGDKPPLMKTREEMRIEDARMLWKNLLEKGWQITDPKW